MAFINGEYEQRDQQTALTGAVVAAVVERQRVVSETRWRVIGGMVLRLALLALCGYVLWRVRTIVTTLIIAGVFASAASALVEPLTRFRIRFLTPKTQRIAATGLVFVALFGGLFLTISVMIHPFQVEWVQLKANWPHYQTSLQTWAVAAKVWYQGLSPDIKNLASSVRDKQALPSPTAWLGNILTATISWASHVVELILVPVLAFYFTVDGRALRSELLFFLPKGRLRSTMAIMNESGQIMRSYIVAQFWLAMIAGVTVGVGLALLGMPYALILGIFAGVTRVIPIIGPLVGGIPVVGLSFLYGTQQGNPYLWVGVLIFFVVLHLLESKIVMPHLLGKHLHLHAVVILVALLIGGEFFGLMGMFLAAPFAALTRVLIMHFFVIPRRHQEQLVRDSKEATLETATPNGDQQPPLRLTTVEAPSNGSGNGRGMLRLERALRADRESRRGASGDAA